MQAVAQAGQIARAGAEQRDAAGDAFDVGNAAQAAADFTGDAPVIFKQCFDGAMAGRRDVAFAQRVVLAVAQQARAHARHAVVEQ